MDRGTNHVNVISCGNSLHATKNENRQTNQSFTQLVVISRWTEGQSIETLIIDSSLEEDDAAKLEDVFASKIHKVKPQERLGAFKNLKVS